MNPKSLSSLVPSLNLSIFTFLLLFETSVCDHPQFVACLPRQCGNQNISFPFWIEGVQETYCGYPGFVIACPYQQPILRISGNDYIIEEIFYHNQSLRIRNSAVSDSGSVCVSRIRNTTLDGTLDAERYRYLSGVSYLNLLSDCTSPLPEEMGRYQIDCTGLNGDEWGLAMSGGEASFRNALERCRGHVSAPVEAVGGDGIEDYTEALRRGFWLRWIASNCTRCAGSGGRCGYDSASLHFRCFCPDRPHASFCPPSSGGRWNKLRVVVVGISVPTGLVIAIFLFCCFKRKCSSHKSIIFWRKERESHKRIETFLKSYGSLAPKRYTYSEVKRMTKSFKYKLGQGGYGGVYRGELQNGLLVAVKVLNESKGNGEEFINEVASISRTFHVNIVTLMGFCFEGNKRALIYEFMPNGSLEKFIYERSLSGECQLEWETLYQIAVGIARGLEYLHRGCNTRILHFDIKPHNILLDENFCPKISDFGLSKLCLKRESIVSMLGARGTAGYIAPEIFSRNFGGVSHKSDVYSYGMMVLEMVGGRKNIHVGVDRTSEIYFPQWIYKRLVLDEDLGLYGIMNEEENEMARKMIIVGLWCIQTDPSNRPSMSKVMEMLEGPLGSLDVPPRPFLSSPPRQPADSSNAQII